MNVLFIIIWNECFIQILNITNYLKNQQHFVLQEHFISQWFPLSKDEIFILRIIILNDFHLQIFILCKHWVTNVFNYKILKKFIDISCENVSNDNSHMINFIKFYKGYTFPL